MKLPQFFIDRPIFAGVLSIFIVLVGLISYQRLPVSEYPEVVPPTIVLHATFPGADPETIASTVAGPLEQQMTGLNDLLYMLSSSTPDGGMALTLTFHIGADLQAAMVDVQNRIQLATPRLPDDVRRLGVVAQKSGSFLMVVHLIPDAGADYDTLTLVNYANLYIRNRLAGLSGVSNSQVFGGGNYGMRIWLDPERMSAQGLEPLDVENAIRDQNLEIAAGSLAEPPVAGRPALQIQVHTQGRLATSDQFGAIIVHRGAQGQLVHLRDVARVELGGDSYSLRSLLNNQDAAAIVIFQSPGSNAIQVSDEVRAAMADMKAHSFPPGMTFHIVYDPTVFVRDMIHEVQMTLLEAIGLVVVVVIVFLQTWRASLIPLIAVPVSLIGTFAVMYAFGFSINSLSLFGLVLSIGIVVDDAIVVVENVERNIEGGLSPRLATKQAMREVSGPIVATALVLCSVFIPTAFISGLTGRFYQQFALTIAFSTAISAFNSLTLSPALAAVLLKEHKNGKNPGGLVLGWFFRGFNAGFGALRSAYVWTERGAIRLWIVMLMLYAGLLICTVMIFERTPTGFIPEQDKDFLIGYLQLPDGSSLDRTESATRQLCDLARSSPGVDSVVAFPGLDFSFANTSNKAIVFVTLKPFAERRSPELTSNAILGTLQGKFSAIPDALAIAIAPPPILGLSIAGGFKLYLEDKGNIGTPALFGFAQQTIGKMFQSKLLSKRTFTSTSMGLPRLEVTIDRGKLEAQSVQISDVYDALQGYYGTVYVNDFNRFNHTWEVLVQADAAHRMSGSDIVGLKVRNAAGHMVPLASFLTLHPSSGPNIACDYNTLPAIDINGAPNPGVSDDQAKAEMERILGELPRSVTYEWTDLTYQQILAGNTARFIFPICVLLVIMVLAAFYESLVLPLAIILIVPMCLLCALVGVWWTHGANNIMTQIGLIVLVGLACKNAILIVEFAKDAEIHHHKPPLEAALEACRLRLRPILMTSFAFIMGVWPLVVSFGAGAELRQATGIAVFSGMIGVTVFGLLLTPVFYVVLRRLSGNKPLRHHDEAEGQVAAPAHPKAPAEEPEVSVEAPSYVK